MIVLVAPLDWGLGHATRCVPLIRELRAAGHAVVICAAGGGLKLLQGEFPDLVFEVAPAHAMRYTRNRALLLPWLLAQLPLFLLSARRDRRLAESLARKHGAGLVIADGRYGFRSRGLPSVFVTHQLDIVPPGPTWLRALLRPALRRLNRRTLRGFTEIWVPDFAGSPNLSGSLGHPRKAWPRTEYIGPLDRFAGSHVGASNETDSVSDSDITPDVLALISGPEPQRTLFEQKLLAALKTLPGTRILVRGLPGDAPISTIIQHDALNVFDHLPGARLHALLREARSVVCRSGYTTVMELAGLGKRGILFVPTPGQSEQEYLAAHAAEAGLAARLDQDALTDRMGCPTLDVSLRAAQALPGFTGVRMPPFDRAAWLLAHPLLQR